MNSSLYDELWRVEAYHWWFLARRQILQTLLSRYCDTVPGHRLRICELGCGTGGNLAPLSRRHDVVGIECSQDALTYARRRLGNRVQHGSLPDHVNLPNERFDAVLLPDVLEHIEDDVASAARAVSLLRTGGIVIATVPAYQWLYSPRDANHHHFRRYSKSRFTSLWARHNVQIKLLSYYNTVLFPPSALLRLASKWMSREQSTQDLQVPRDRVNNLLRRIMQSESHLLGRVPLPFGLSLIAVVQKCASARQTSPGAHARRAA